MDRANVGRHLPLLLRENLRSALDAVLFALEFEEQEDSSSALNSYQDARSHISFILEGAINGHQEPLIAEACRGFLDTYDTRIESLAKVASDRVKVKRSEIEEQHLEIIQQCKKDVKGNLDEVAGMREVKEQLREGILLPMRFPSIFTGVRRPPSNFLLYGPPGTGKTLLVEKLGAEAGVSLLALSPSSVMSKWSGESERTIKGVFEAARANQPAIVFMDEIDSLAPKRRGQDDLISRRVLTEILIQMTNAQDDDQVFVFGATNRMEDCDDALLRRFDRRIHVPLPDAAARKAFFHLVLSRPELGSCLSERELDVVVDGTTGYTGSDLTLVCREAALVPVREALQRLKGCSSLMPDAGSRMVDADAPFVRGISADDMFAAIRTIKPSFVEE